MRPTKTPIDDTSRVAYIDVFADERPTCAAFPPDAAAGSPARANHRPHTALKCLTALAALVNNVSGNHS